MSIKSEVEKAFKNDFESNDEFYGHLVNYDSDKNLFNPHKDNDIFWRNNKFLDKVIEKEEVKKFKVIEDLIKDPSWKKRFKGFMIKSRSDYYKDTVVYTSISKFTGGEGISIFRTNELGEKKTFFANLNRKIVMVK